MRIAFAKIVGDGRTLTLSEYRTLYLADLERVRTEAHTVVDDLFDQQRAELLADLAHVHDPLPDDSIHRMRDT